MSDPQLFADPAQPTWVRPKSKAACGRDPKAGPGTCWHWWEGCPKAEQRGCYLRWRALNPAAAQGADEVA